MPRASGWVAPAIAVCVLWAGGSESAVLRVPSEYATIQVGVDAAGAGDSVLVAPGTYTDIERRVVDGFLVDSCLFLKTGVTVVSEAGPEATVIDMQETPGSLPNVVLGFALGLPEAVLDGFSVLGAPYGKSALLVYDSEKITVRRCVFRDGDAGTSNVGGMGVDETDLDLIDCVFERCRGYGAGAVYHSGADLFVSGCTFVDCERTAVQAWAELPNDFRAVIEDCTFVGNRDPAGNGGGLAVRQYGGGCEVRRCVFVDNECRDGGGGADLGVFGAVVQDCVFWNNSSLQSWAGALYVGAGDVRGCTFWGSSGVSQGSAVVFQGSPSSFSNSIVANTAGGAALRATSGVVLTGGCNVFWNNAGGHAQNYTFAPTDRILDPLFCDEAAGDLTLQAASPCLPEFSGGCGLIGAEEQGCGVISVEAKSWGKVKEAYRSRPGGRP